MKKHNIFFSFQQTINDDMYVKSHFVTLVGSNVKWSKIKPYAWYINICLTTNWIGNWILMTMCERL
jgi:hypothetical protein